MAAAVVVTGASTGIGRATALRLARNGFHVFAGVRKPADGESLRAEAPGGITPLQLDVTDAEQLAAAVRSVEQQVGAQGLQGLVNNAGISGGAPTEFLPLAELRGMIEVNVVGVVAATQAFLPLLRKGNGRVVCIGSIGGRFAVPFLAAYSMTKAAVSALCDSLRGELRPWGIHVALVEPGAISTPIWEKGLRDVDEAQEKWPSAAMALYGDAIPRMRRITERTASHAIPAEKVAKVVEHALTARRPRTRYIVGADAHVQAIVRRIPDRVRDAMIARTIGLPKKA
ncbi:MAG TPA: SDR family oxidoreductase [Candidatus Angelobacter sp.]|jgi:NAD(P)-dependent dehydrogenase (short-subunit alcohol dehydrogenase family)|nr:SDR family oxidoreductase [Candidatus Angelobacter sp.]